MTRPLPSVSIVIPCRNEARYLAPCLDSILTCAYPRDRLQILVADGLSDDGTREIATRYAAEHPEITVLDNPGRIVPTGLNAAIRAATGDVIVRMDAHVTYPPDYLTRLVDALAETGAQNVGGVIATCPAEDTAMARAIALGLSHRLGVGNSYFRIGTDERRWVDTVPFGCYPREVFARIGLFDEELVRNQDDEFNFRLLTRGGRILLLPDVVSCYYPRGSLRQTARMYYQYGYFKPLVARKVGRVMTVRQLVPAAFLLALALTGGLAPWWRPAAVGFGVLTGLYAAAILTAAAAAVPRHGIRCASVLAAVFAVLHCSYGFGFLRGLIDHLLLRGRTSWRPTTVPLSR